MRSLQAAWYVKNKDRILTQQAAKRAASKDSRSAITNEAGMNRRMREIAPDRQITANWKIRRHDRLMTKAGNTKQWLPLPLTSSAVTRPARSA
jgi:hypothetical protein